eukprot:m.108351 g.108351  ORF g.108351 m.108351 type:complete len:120 (-) comp13344_c2_seq1:535-894(-)
MYLVVTDQISSCTQGNRPVLDTHIHRMIDERWLATHLWCSVLVQVALTPSQARRSDNASGCFFGKTASNPNTTNRPKTPIRFHFKPCSRLISNSTRSEENTFSTQGPSLAVLWRIKSIQ